MAKAHEINRQTHPNELAHTRRWELKHSEPHDRLQDAIGLQRVQWSKPPKSGGTTRVELT